MVNTRGMNIQKEPANVLVYAYDDRVKENGTTGCDVKLNMSEGANPTANTQSEPSLMADKRGNATKRTVDYGKETMDRLKDCPSVPLLSKDGKEIGTIYSASATFTPCTREGKPTQFVKEGDPAKKAAGYRMVAGSIQPGPPIPENIKDVQYAMTRADQAKIATAKFSKQVGAQAQSQAGMEAGV